jgi:transposase
MRAKASPKSKKFASVQSLPVCEPNAAGIDVGASELYVAVPPDRAEQPVRCFGTFTSDLTGLIVWLKTCRITAVAMESTGVYWIPVFQRLEEAGIRVCLVNARHVKNVPGRKTDVRDCQWLQYLHSVGLLRASFRPAQEICALRTLGRHRENLLRQAAQEVQRMQKALDEMNLPLHHVISDLVGQTGSAIIMAILSGERDPRQLIQLRDRRIKASSQTLIKALEGDYRSELIFVLRQSWAGWNRLQEYVGECDAEMARMIQSLEGTVDLTQCPVPPSTKGQRREKTSKNQPEGPWRQQFYRMYGVDLTSVPCISVSTVHTLFTELGRDWTRFPTAGHFASWLGLCPDNEISGGKVLRRRTRRTQQRVKNALRMAAQSLVHCKTSILGVRFRRLRSRMGSTHAITAGAHCLARILWTMVRDRKSYDESLLAEQEAAHQERQKRRLKNLAKQFGFTLVQESDAAVDYESVP